MALSGRLGGISTGWGRVAGAGAGGEGLSSISSIMKNRYLQMRKVMILLLLQIHGNSKPRKMS